jgi:2-aminoethylphosphonate dioxygenase
MEAHVDQETLEHFHRFGWAIARGFYDNGQSRDLTAAITEMTDIPEVSGRQMVYREKSLLDPQSKVIQRIEDFCPYNPKLDAIVRTGRLNAAIESLFGEPALLFKDKVNFKMPGGAGFEAHQDQQAGWSRYANYFITAMVTIDPTTLENGCLEIPSAPRATKLVGREWEPLNSDELTGFNLTPVPTAAGDVVFFDSYVPHASKPNLTQSSRRVLYLTYNRASDGDHRARYYSDKRQSFPPDIDRAAGEEYRFRV